MDAVKVLEILEERKKHSPEIKSWIELKRAQFKEMKSKMHVEQDWVRTKDKPWKQDIHVTVHAPSDPGKIKGLIVAFHGLGNFGQREYFYFAPWFVEKGYIVVTPDMPYFGHNVKHPGVHGRIGKWQWQLQAMTEAIRWALARAESYTKSKVKASDIPWYLVGISMSGLGVLEYGLTNLESSGLISNCKGVVALVPAVKVAIKVNPLQMLAVFIISKIAPDFIYLQPPVVDPDTGLYMNSHDLNSVSWCSMCVEPGDAFGLDGEDATKEFQIDAFPSSPLSTVKKIYYAMKRTFNNAEKWPNVPLFLTGSSKDDMVDPTGAEEFGRRIDPAIPHQFKLYEGWYHSQLCEKDREELFQDILEFFNK